MLAIDKGSAVNFCVERLTKSVGSKMIINEAIANKLGIISVSLFLLEKSFGIFSCVFYTVQRGPRPLQFGSIFEWISKREMRVQPDTVHRQ